MSACKFSIFLSPRAIRDFSDILLYTAQVWGERQVAEYKNSIDKAIKLISDYPYIGKKVPRVGKELLVFPASEHIIVYRVKNNTIHVARILHKRMNIQDVVP